MVTKADLIADLDAGLTIETPPDEAGLFATALRERELYVLYQWQPGGRLAFETFDDVALLVEKMAGCADLERWRPTADLAAD